MTAMESIADVTIAAATEMPRFEDGFINLQEVLRQLAESAVNEIMSAEADQLCEAAGEERVLRHLFMADVTFRSSRKRY